MKIILGVCGSISAYKAPSIANALRKEGHEVKIILTDSATEFIGKMAFLGQGYETFLDKDEWNHKGVLHVELANESDIFLVAPMSCNTLAKFANGYADNLLMSSLKVFGGSGKKIIFAPAMNTKMFLDAITQKNIEIIKEAYPNVVFVEPDSKLLACGENGIGALAKIEKILEAI